MDYARPDLVDALAAQYVAGTLRGPARRRFEALLPGHPALQAAVQRWRDRLLPLTVALPPAEPPPAVWLAIERRLWPTTNAANSAGQPAAASAASGREPWWRSMAFWRFSSGMAAVLALGLALRLALPGDAQPPVVVVLQATPDMPGGAAGLSLVASLSADGRALVTRPIQPVALAADRVLELWAVPPEGAPRSLGLISANGVTVVGRQRLPAALLDARRTAALAVSVEPPGGSPTGTPTGPVVFAGKLQL